MEKLQILTLVLLIFFSSCTNSTKTANTKSNHTIADKIKPVDTLKQNFQTNINYYTDSLVKETKGVIKHYFQTYHADTCGNRTYSNVELKENFEGIRIVKGITNKKRADTLFVIPPFNYCEDGDAYCFFDKSLPRLLTDSYCCQPDNLFVVDDIDEDGICEIGIYYSSCSGRYKSLRIYSLKQNNWQEISTSIFDVLTQDPMKVKFDELVKKQSKNTFKICSFKDGKTVWETLAMK